MCFTHLVLRVCLRRGCTHTSVSHWTVKSFSLPACDSSVFWYWVSPLRQAHWSESMETHGSVCVCVCVCVCEEDWCESGSSVTSSFFGAERTLPGGPERDGFIMRWSLDLLGLDHINSGVWRWSEVIITLQTLTGSYASILRSVCSEITDLRSEQRNCYPKQYNKFLSLKYSLNKKHENKKRNIFILPKQTKYSNSLFSRLNKQTLYCVTWFICGGPCHLSSSNRVLGLSSESSSFVRWWNKIHLAEYIKIQKIYSSTT